MNRKSLLLCCLIGLLLVLSGIVCAAAPTAPDPAAEVKLLASPAAAGAPGAGIRSHGGTSFVYGITVDVENLLGIGGSNTQSTQGQSASPQAKAQPAKSQQSTPSKPEGGSPTK